MLFLTKKITLLQLQCLADTNEIHYIQLNKLRIMLKNPVFSDSLHNLLINQL